MAVQVSQSTKIIPVVFLEFAFLSFHNPWAQSFLTPGSNLACLQSIISVLSQSPPHFNSPRRDVKFIGLFCSVPRSVGQQGVLQVVSRTLLRIFFFIVIPSRTCLCFAVFVFVFNFLLRQSHDVLRVVISARCSSCVLQFF